MLHRVLRYYKNNITIIYAILSEVNIRLYVMHKYFENHYKALKKIKFHNLSMLIKK